MGSTSLCYLAYLLLSLLQYRLRKTDFTAESALLELGSMHKVYLRDAKNRFHLSRIVTLTRKQELGRNREMTVVSGRITREAISFLRVRGIEQPRGRRLR
jgi:hypothetical protein